MTPAIVEAIAEALHKEYRAAHKALSENQHKHDHGWKFCHNKHYFLKRAERMGDIFRYVTLSDPDVTAALVQLQHARDLLATVISAYGALDRQHHATIVRLKQDIDMARAMLEGATAAGITFDYNPETSCMDARNKLAEKRPTRIIKIAYTTPVGLCVDITPAVETVPDATGDSGNSESLPWTDKTRSQVAAEWDVLL